MRLCFPRYETGGALNHQTHACGCVPYPAHVVCTALRYLGVVRRLLLSCRVFQQWIKTLRVLPWAWLTLLTHIHINTPPVPYRAVFCSSRPAIRRANHLSRSLELGINHFETAQVGLRRYELKSKVLKNCVGLLQPNEK